VVFEGNTSTSSSALRDELTLLSRGSYDDYEVSASADAIQRYYQQRGGSFARVDWRRERLSAEEERIVFMIDEGPELRVRGIEFAGNSRLSSKELADVVSVRKWPWMGLGAGGYVTGRQMEGDVERIVEHYKSKGFLEAKARAEAATSPAALGQIGAVAAAPTRRRATRARSSCAYTVDEGPQLLVERRDFRTDNGAPLPYTKRFLYESVTLKPGAPVHARGRARRQPAPGAAARRRRLPVEQRRPE
jgi:outer membrane protein assembly factor BamA